VLALSQSSPTEICFPTVSSSLAFDGPHACVQPRPKPQARTPVPALLCHCFRPCMKLVCVDFQCAAPELRSSSFSSSQSIQSALVLSPIVRIVESDEFFPSSLCDHAVCMIPWRRFPPRRGTGLIRSPCILVRLSCARPPSRPTRLRRCQFVLTAIADQWGTLVLVRIRHPRTTPLGSPSSRDDNASRSPEDSTWP